jgi:hypothetical protein
MTIAYRGNSSVRHVLLACALAGVPIGVACAVPPPVLPAPQVLVALPPPGAAFQQTVQQQLHQDVSNISKRPFAGNPQTLQQIDQASQMQQQRDRASQQDLLDSYRAAAALPQGAPVLLQRPATVHSGG